MLSTREEWQQVQYNLIYRHAKRLLRLINQIMDIRKLEAGGLQLEVTQNDIVRFANDIADSFNFEALERKIDYTFISNENRFLVWFDKDKLDKILYNLIANAFKFTPEGGKITILIHVNEVSLTNNLPGTIEITVEDNGIGISQESLSKVFERFYQADTSSKNQGTGLGLALTKELVELHQGKIHVESNPSIGTRFSVILPLGKDHLENYQLSKKDTTYNNDNDFLENKNTIDNDNPEDYVQVIHSNESNEIVSGKLPLLLIVEDNPDLRLFIKNEFNRQFKVIEAKDGLAGYNMAIERIPDLIISDIMMPGMEGFELCKKLKADESTCHIPLILLTALSSEEKIVTGLETGADDYITKPFNSKVLKARVTNLIESRYLLRKQFSKYGEIPESIKMPTNLDQNFLQRAFQIIEKNISNEEYDAYQFSTEMGISRSLMYKKINALTGMTVHELIRNIRLKKAAELLMSKKYNVSETASEVGFKDLSYFIRCFSKQYGVSPSKYLSSRNI